MSSPVGPNDRLLRVAPTELALHWRSSRHARRLLTLALFGVFIATVARRPEFAGVAAPALLLLAAGRVQRRPPRITVRARPSSRRGFEGELMALDVDVEGQDDCTVRWTLHPGQEIGPVGATAADGQQARFTFTPERWGRRQIGTIDVLLRDRWRLAEGHASVTLPRLDCYPAPAQQRTKVVLRHLPNRLGEHPARTSGEGIEFFGVRETLRKVPWEEGALIAILWLEVLHPSRPWHTAVLGAALIAYLLATHLAESAASLGALGPQVRVLAVGAGLLALGAGAGMLPKAGPGPARRCCGWWRRARSSPRPASPCRMSRDSRGPPITEGTPCRDIQEGHRIPRSSWDPGAYDEPGQAGRWGFTGLTGGQDPMAEIVRAGLIQQRWTGDKDSMIAAAVNHIQTAASDGAAVVCLQELFYGPYFCQVQDADYYSYTEAIPDGPTTRLLQDVARQHGIVIIAPMYEEEHPGLYYNTAAVIDADGSYLGKYRKTHIPQVKGFWEKFYFRPGNMGYPVFDTAVGRIGVYICYDRHFPEGWRALGLAGARIVFNPSATSRGLSQYLWRLEQPASAVANEYFIGAINRVGVEPLGDNDFYGQTYFVDPRGQLVGDPASDDKDEVLVRDLDMEQLAEVRNLWQFYRDRRPDAYGSLVQP